MAHAIAERYRAWRRRFDSVTRRAGERFEARDWRGLRADALERVDAYETEIAGAVLAIAELLGGRLEDRGLWATAKGEYRKLIATRPDLEIAETFFNSVTRRVFHTRGIDPAIEFVTSEPLSAVPVGPGMVRVVDFPPSTRWLVEELLRIGRFQAHWQDRHGDVAIAAEALGRQLTDHGMPNPPERVEIVDRVLYRGQSAYLVARARAGQRIMPIAMVVHHRPRGLVLGAMLCDREDVSILFSYTRSAFLVDAGDPATLVRFLHTLLPHRRVAELYTAIGHRKHGKTELYRDLMTHVAGTGERFVHAPGQPGLVMIVFTLPGYDLVFKVIRDRFPPQKDTTPDQVREKYRLVSRHDRAGRLIDAQEFEHLRFPADRFDPRLLGELTAEASRVVELVGGDVVLRRVYLERRVTPLDLYLRHADPVSAEAAIVDYGATIKNLAASNIFPGDMLLKNFGVTRTGRVVFYDYDELRLLTEVNFRAMPVAEDPLDEMADAPWFGVAVNDVFPEEFRVFLGVGGRLREAFERYHRDLYSVGFWRGIQERIRRGEVIEIIPYRRSRALHRDA